MLNLMALQRYTIPVDKKYLFSRQEVLIIFQYQSLTGHRHVLTLKSIFSIMQNIEKAAMRILFSLQLKIGNVFNETQAQEK